MSRLFTNFTRVCLRVYASLRQVVPLMQAQLMLMRKRPLTLILLILLGCGFILTTGFHLALYAFAILPVTSNTCPATSSQQGGQSVPCFTETPQQQEQQKLLRQEVLREQKNALAFPA